MLLNFLALIRGIIYLFVLGGAGLLGRLILVFTSSFIPFIQLPLLLLFGQIIDPLVIALLAVLLPTKPVFVPSLKQPFRAISITTLAVWIEMMLGSGAVLLPLWVVYYATAKGALGAALTYFLWRIRYS